MSVEFEEDKLNLQRVIMPTETPPEGLVKFLLDKGLVKSKKVAQIALLIFVAVIIILSFVIYSSSGETTSRGDFPIISF